MLWVPLKSKLTVREAAHVIVQLERDGHQVLQARPVVGRTGEALLLQKKGYNQRKGQTGGFHLKSPPAHVEVAKFGGNPCQRKPQGDICSVYLGCLEMQHFVRLYC